MSPADLDRQPTLEGELLLLRPMAEADWQALFAVAADRLIWEQHPAHDRWKEPVFRSFFSDAMAQGGALVMIDKASDTIIGSSRFQGLETEDGGSVEIGWTFLARAYWGGTVNLEMKRLMVAHALRSVAECRFAVGAENWRSRKAMEKIGGRLTSRTEMREMADGESRYVHYVIGKDEYRSGLLGTR